MKNKKFIIIIALVIVATFFATAAFLVSPLGSSAYYRLSVMLGGRKSAKLAVIEKLIDDNFIGEVHKDYMVDLASAGYASGSCDRYTTYYTQNQYKAVTDNLDGGYSGVGITVEAKNNKLIIARVMKNTPAHRSGLCEGDIIHKVDGVSYLVGERNKMVEHIRGLEEGSTVTFTIERGGMVFDIEIVLEEIELDYIAGTMLDGNIGYIRIDTFGTQIGEEFKNEVNRLVQTQGAKSLIFDVRSNPGGSLESVVEMVDFLVGEGDIVTVKQKNEKDRVFTSDKNEINLPMCVLVNSESASASELFAGALSDHGKATIIGEKTYGKGVVQNVYSLGDGTAVSITIAKYYTPSGKCIDGQGIKPDIEVMLPDEVTISEYDASLENDTQLQRAVDELK